MQEYMMFPVAVLKWSLFVGHACRDPVCCSVCCLPALRAQHALPRQK